MKKWVCPVCGYVHEGDVPDYAPRNANYQGFTD